MMPSDFVYSQVYKGCLKQGVRESIAKDSAVMAVDSFKKNKFKKKVSDLIESSIKAAKTSEKRQGVKL